MKAAALTIDYVNQKTEYEFHLPFGRGHANYWRKFRAI